MQIRTEEYKVTEDDITLRLKSDSALRSVARRRLVLTENPSACPAVDCKLCESGIAL
jgi:hypothetical protein